MQTQATSDRIQTLAIMISATTGRVYRFFGIQSVTVSKDDSGNAGTWSFQTSGIAPTELYGQSDDAAEYMQVAGPMDLCAIFARRLSVTAGMRQERPLYPIGPDSLSALSYGGDGGATVEALGAPLPPSKTLSQPLSPASGTCCLMVGMLDAAFEIIQAGRTVGFQAQGKDLSKIAYVNFAQVPATNDSSLGVPPLISIALAENTNGRQLLIDLMDALVAKKLPKSAITNGLPQSTASAFAAYGYPWSDFISLARLTDPNFRPFTSGKFPPFQLQGGSAWANVLELANLPINRLFIDELGQLVFDDAYTAWTAAPVYSVPSSDISAFVSGFSDENLITYLSTFPSWDMAARAPISGAFGVLGRNNSFVGGLAEAKSPDDAHVKTYGYRYAEFQSNYDIDLASTAVRRKAVIFSHNNLWRASATVRGNPFYRVGDRYLINQKTNRAETTDKAWYCRSVQHQIQQDDEWSINLDLAYPPVT